MRRAPANELVLEPKAATTGSDVPMTSDHAQPFVAPGPIRRVALIVGDILEAVAIVLCVPFVIVAIGMPFVLCARFLLWIVGML